MQNTRAMDNSRTRARAHVIAAYGESLHRESRCVAFCDGTMPRFEQTSIKMAARTCLPLRLSVPIRARARARADAAKKRKKKKEKKKRNADTIWRAVIVAIIIDASNRRAKYRFANQSRWHRYSSFGSQLLRSNTSIAIRVSSLRRRRT